MLQVFDTKLWHRNFEKWLVDIQKFVQLKKYFVGTRYDIAVLGLYENSFKGKK